MISSLKTLNEKIYAHVLHIFNFGLHMNCDQLLLSAKAQIVNFCVMPQRKVWKIMVSVACVELSWPALIISNLAEQGDYLVFLYHLFWLIWRL